MSPKTDEMETGVMKMKTLSGIFSPISTHGAYPPQRPYNISYRYRRLRLNSDKKNVAFGPCEPSPYDAPCGKVSS